MATEVDQGYYNAWPRDELSDGDDHKAAVTPQMHDHGSISFGRFSVESLSWERRSVFVHNRHQEELEKFNGLVAEKKAYFEERYRRIRASKALKQNQQTELTLDYGVDSSVSSQTEEENESTSQQESPRETVDARAEEIKVRDPFEQESSYKEVLPVSSVIEPTPAIVPQEISLSEESTGIIEHGESSNDDTHVEPLKMESWSLTGNVEVTDEVHKGSIEHAKPKLENLEPKVENKSLNKVHVKGINDSQPNMSGSTKKPLYSKSVPNLKGTAATSRNGQILDRAPKQNATQQPKGIKRPSQKISGKTENSQTVGSRRTVQQVNNNGLISALAPSNRSPAEPRSKITTQGPFTLAMERRASSRMSRTKLDTMNSMRLSSSIHSSNGSSMQDMSKKRATVSGVTSRRVESKRLITEVKNPTKKPLAADSRHTSMRRNEAPIQGTIKPRLSSSINLPARNSNVRTEAQLSTPKLQKLEGKATNQIRQPQGVAAKSLGSSMNGNTKIVTKKPIKAKYNERINDGNKPRLDNLSLDGRKAR